MTTTTARDLREGDVIAHPRDGRPVLVHALTPADERYDVVELMMPEGIIELPSPPGAIVLWYHRLDGALMSTGLICLPADHAITHTTLPSTHRSAS